MEFSKKALEGFPDKGSKIYMPHVIGKVSYGDRPLCIIAINVFVGIVEKMTTIRTTTDVTVNNGRGNASVSSISDHGYKVRLLDAEGDFFREIEFHKELSPAVGDEITLWYLVDERCVQDFLNKKNISDLRNIVAINNSNRHSVHVESFVGESYPSFVETLFITLFLGGVCVVIVDSMRRPPDILMILAAAVFPVSYIFASVGNFKTRSNVKKFRAEMHDFIRRETSNL